MFIELQDVETGKEIMVNVKHVIATIPITQGGTRVLLANRQEATVRESYERVKQLIAYQVAAERGY